MTKVEIPGTPQSVNTLYFNDKRGIRRLKYSAKDYKDNIKWIAKTKFRLTDKPVKVEIDYYFGDKRRRDVTNYDKAILDALVDIAYEDDSQIQEITLRKFIDKTNPRFLITIHETRTQTENI